MTKHTVALMTTLLGLGVLVGALLYEILKVVRAIAIANGVSP